MTVRLLPNASMRSVLLVCGAIIFSFRGRDVLGQVPFHSTAPISLRALHAGTESPWQREVTAFTVQALRFQLLQNTKSSVTVDSAPSCAFSAVQQASMEQRVSSAATRFDITLAIRANADSSFLVDVRALRCVGTTTAPVLTMRRVLSAIATANDVQALTSLVSERVRVAMLPKVRVTMIGPTTDDTATSRTTRTIIVEAVTRERDFEAVDSLPDYDIVLTRTPTNSSALVTVLQVRDTIRKAEFQVSLASNTLSADAAGQVIHARLSEYLHAQELGSSTNSTIDSLSVIARRVTTALCLKPIVSCKTDIKAAIATLSAGGPRVWKDPEALTLFARAMLADGRIGDALQMADSALVLWSNTPASARRAEAIPSLHLLIGDVYSSAGNGRDAVKQYVAARQGEEADTLLVTRLTRAYRLANDDVGALRVAATAAQSAVRRGSATSASRIEGVAVEIVSAMDVKVLSDSSQSIVPLCLMLSRQRIESCARRYGAASEQALQAREPLRRVVALAQSAFALGLMDPELRARAAVSQATASLGEIEFATKPDGSLVMSSNSAHLGAVDSLDALVRVMPDASKPREVQGALARVRSYRVGLAGDVKSSHAEALRAFQILPSRDAIVLLGQASIVLASNARVSWRQHPDSQRLPERLHVDSSLNQAKVALQGAVDAYGQDDIVLGLLAQFCGEYAVDRRCNFNANVLRMKAGLLQKPREVYDAVEAAVVFDQFPLALQWLSRVSLEKLSGCDGAIGDLYAYWVSAQTYEPTLAKQHFERWTKNTQQWRNSTSRLCWYFSAAYDRLRASPSLTDHARITAMVLAMDNKLNSMPSAPGDNDLKAKAVVP